MQWRVSSGKALQARHGRKAIHALLDRHSGGAPLLRNFNLLPESSCAFLPGNPGVFGNTGRQTRLNDLIAVNGHGDDSPFAGPAENVVAALDPLQGPARFHQNVCKAPCR